MSALPRNAADAPPDDLTGLRVAHYEVGEPLGRGGMGVVYRALDTRLGREVALKVLASHLAHSRAARARFLREARAASALDHPNLATLYEVGEHEETLYLTMPLLDGETLQSRIARGPVPLDEARAILAQLLAGLGAAHAAGIVHRDVKPGNVMLTLDGRVRLLDFGLAKLTHPRDGGDAITSDGEFPGTLLYMAPEQLHGKAADARADLWAVGVVAYEMLTGSRPFDVEERAGATGASVSATRVVTNAAILARILTKEPAPIAVKVASVPRGVSDVVMRLLEKDPERRFHSAAEAAAAFAEPRERDDKSGSSRARSRLFPRTRRGAPGRAWRQRGSAS